MSEEDRFIINGFRKAMNVGVVEELKLDGIHVIEWFKVMGWENEPKVDDLARKSVVCEDGVHSFDAVSLLFRISEMEVQGTERVRGEQKRGNEPSTKSAVAGMKNRRNRRNLRKRLTL
jgi:hypothetical protein